MLVISSNFVFIQVDSEWIPHPLKPFVSLLILWLKSIKTNFRNRIFDASSENEANSNDDVGEISDSVSPHFNFQAFLIRTRRLEYSKRKEFSNIVANSCGFSNNPKKYRGFSPVGNRQIFFSFYASFSPQVLFARKFIQTSTTSWRFLPHRLV